MFAAGFPAVVPEIIPELAYLALSLAGCFQIILELVVGNDEYTDAMRRQQMLKDLT
jgi:organic hydroperoxide reductase OsmC/OhrA